jgi:PAP2 superfamily
MSLVGHTDHSATPDADRSPTEEPRRRIALRGARTLRDGRRLYWWLEIVFVVAFYVVYSAIRNANDAHDAEALRHAHQVIDLQRWLGLYIEPSVQRWALHLHPLIVAANYFYGSLHFVVTGGVMVFLYRRFTNDYPRWRNTLAVATGIALIGFAFYPLMPPRLLPLHGYSFDGFRFVDTLAKDPAFWSFDSGAVSKISNQFAAMPSVHCAWALWCACALVPRVRHTWAKVLAALYPVATVTAIVITANHYWLDAAAGFAVFGVGYAAGRAFTRAGRTARLAVNPVPART